MRYKRDESFRYVLETPISGTFQILEINEEKVDVTEGALTIINLSPGGVRIQAPYQLPDPKLYSILLNIHFHINDCPFKLKGIVQWIKPISNEYQYGLEIQATEIEKKELISELKRYAKHRNEDD